MCHLCFRPDRLRPIADRYSTVLILVFRGYLHDSYFEMFVLSHFPNGMRRLLSIRSGHCHPCLVSSSYFLLVLWILIHMDPHSFGCPGSGSVLGMRDPDPGA
jgi:hypothetical protein